MRATSADSFLSGGRDFASDPVGLSAEYVYCGVDFKPALPPASLTCPEHACRRASESTICAGGHARPWPCPWPIAQRAKVKEPSIFIARAADLR